MEYIITIIVLMVFCACLLSVTLLGYIQGMKDEAQDKDFENTKDDEDEEIH